MSIGSFPDFLKAAAYSILRDAGTLHGGFALFELDPAIGHALARTTSARADRPAVQA
jgi:acyl-coenzyme A thioesterase PaaI-like protein